MFWYFEVRIQRRLGHMAQLRGSELAATSARPLNWSPSTSQVGCGNRLSGSRNSPTAFGQVGSCGSFKAGQSTWDVMQREGDWRGSGKLQQDRWAIFEEVFQLREPKAPKAFRRFSFCARLQRTEVQKH